MIVNFLSYSIWGYNGLDGLQDQQQKHGELKAVIWQETDDLEEDHIIVVCKMSSCQALARLSLLRAAALSKTKF